MPVVITSYSIHYTKLYDWQIDDALHAPILYPAAATARADAAAAGYLAYLRSPEAAAIFARFGFAMAE